MTNACNLKCEYCYINQNSKKLTFDVLKKQIKNIQYLSKKIDDGFDGEYDVTYFGGEPLLEYENILLFDEYLKTNLNVVHSFMQTNGILLNDKIKNEFDTRNIHIGISCDGCNDNNYKYIEQLYKNKIVEMQPKNDDNLYTDDGARYYENIGKLMFEFILLGKESQYLPKNKKFYDSLSEYMNYLDLDDNNTYIFTSKEKQYFEEKLFMQSNDEFLSLF